jgi:hypothetical protein
MGLWAVITRFGLSVRRTISFRPAPAFPHVLRGRVVAETDRAKWVSPMPKFDGQPQNED